MSEKIYNDITVVNEQDEVLGGMPLPDAIAQGAIRRVSRIFIYNTSGELLLQKRSQHVMKPGLWDHSASGHVDIGNTYDQTAEQEVCEELSLCDIELSPLIPPRRATELGTGNFYVAAYSAVVPTGQTVTVSPHEVAAVEWFSEDALARAISEKPESFTPAFREDWEQFRTALFPQ